MDVCQENGKQDIWMREGPSPPNESLSERKGFFFRTFLAPCLEIEKTIATAFEGGDDDWAAD